MEAWKVMRGSSMRTSSKCFFLLGWGPGKVGLIVKELYFLPSFHIVLNLQFYCHYFIPPENLKQILEVPDFQDTDYLFHLSSKRVQI